MRPCYKCTNKAKYVVSIYDEDFFNARLFGYLTQQNE